jgi:hypothetical protein
MKLRSFRARSAVVAIGAAASVVVAGGTALAAPALPQPNDSGRSAISCTGPGVTDGPPGPAFLVTGAAGPNRLTTPAGAAAFLGFPSLGAAIDVFCSTPPE